MRVLVTGGAGFIGAHLVRRLIQDGYADVTVLDNLKRGSFEALSDCRDRFRFIRGSITDRELLRRAMMECGVVFHLAAQSNVIGAAQDPDYTFNTNVLGAFEVLRAARHCKAVRVVFTSSREVYGETEGGTVSEICPLRPKNPYGASKAIGEILCSSFSDTGLEAVILRLANVYGPGDSERVIPIFVENALSGKPLFLFGGTQVIDFVWVGTVIDALIRAGFGAWVQEPVNVGSGVGTRLTDLARRICVLTGSESEIRFAPARSIEVEHFIADIRRASQVFDITRPDEPLFGLPQVVDSFRAKPENSQCWTLAKETPAAL
jgi:UDP-glucose 4-epimerase